MIQHIVGIFKYIRLIYHVQRYVSSIKNGEPDIEGLSQLILRVKSCGAVAIKFCQWSIPKLESMFVVKENPQPEWLTILEGLYEDCDYHDEAYTIEQYESVFKSDFYRDYEILDIIGSGSIGQVYLVQNKPLTIYSEPQKYVMKVRHPHVATEIATFRSFYNIIGYLPYIKTLLNDNFPFDIRNFIDQFEEQSDFIIESNNLLKFKESYDKNPSIIIPDLIRVGTSIMIMSYEKGIAFDTISDIDSHRKYKAAVLLASFMKNNQHILNFHHGDLHKGNWKVRIEDGNYKLVIYDFGFCWKVPEFKLSAIEKIREIFEETDDEVDALDLVEAVEIFRYFIKYDIKDEEHITNSVREYIENHLDDIAPWAADPSRLFKTTVNLCTTLKLHLDPLLIQVLIIMIQCQKILIEFRMLGSDTEPITTHEVFRSKYIDFITFFSTYDIFPELTEYLTDILDSHQTHVAGIFDYIEMPDSIKQMALKNK